MRFKKIYIEITNQCNLNCTFCIKNSRIPKFLSIQEFTFILKQIQPYTKYIYLHILGEPLLHPQLQELLQIAHKMNFFVNITTNGTLLKKMFPILQQAKAIRQINVSLHSFPNQPSYLNDVTETCDQLSNFGIYISYRLWTIEESLSIDMKQTLDYLENHYHITIDTYKNSIKLKPHCFLSFDSTFEWPTLNQPYIGKIGTCHGWRHMCGILVDGSVVPCCLDSKGEAILGNIYQQSFQEILFKSNQLLHDFQNHKMSLELCQRCSYRCRFDQSEQNVSLL